VQRALSGCTFCFREGTFVSHCCHNGKVFLLQLALNAHTVVHWY
jgi:hypothetical protein